MTTALLLIDIQNDYFPGGEMTLFGMERTANRAASLLEGFRERNLPRYHVRHLSTRPGATFFLPDTWGAEIEESVKPLENEPVIVKHFPNSFRDTDLRELLRRDGVDRLVIAGAMSHMCVDATTRAAFDLGFACAVAEDACATRDLEFKGKPVPAAAVHGAFMAALAAVYAEVRGTGDLLASL